MFSGEISWPQLAHTTHNVTKTNLMKITWEMFKLSIMTTQNYNFVMQK